jgi:surface antigen
MMKKINIAVALVSLSLVLGGCTTTPTKQQTGAGVGAALGAALGYGLGKGHHNKELAIALGAIFGAIAGDYVGAQMDERDQLMAAQNLQYSLELHPDGTTSTWQNPNSGNSGFSYPTKTSIMADGTPCREFTATIVIGGENQQGYGTACRQPDGSWKII